MSIEKDTHVTDVVFRKFNKKNGGGIIALFPYLLHNRYDVESYMHIGQHGVADYNHCVSISRPATKDEYSGLKNELESIGYNLNVITKRSYAKFVKARREQLNH